MKFSQNEKQRKKFPLNIFIILFLLVLTPFVFSQVVQTQVIELTERVRDYFIEATKGNIIGQETVNKFGQNLAVGTGTFEDIQSQGGVLVFLEAAEIISIVSTDAADDMTGTNARSVEIIGLSGNFTEISEVVFLDGLVSVNTTQEYIRVTRMRVDSVGGYGNSNLGTITGTAFFDGTTQIEIPLGEGQSKTTHFTIPAGENGIITTTQITMDTGKAVDVKLRVRENADNVTVPVKPIKTLRDWRGLDTSFQITSRANLLLPEKTDIWFEAVTTGGAGSEVEVNYDLIQYAIGQ